MASRIALSRCRLLALAWAAGLGAAISTFSDAAYAQTSADLFLTESPLTEIELQEARGGFRAGGFEFDFGVSVTVLSAPIGDVFRDEGLFSDIVEAPTVTLSPDETTFIITNTLNDQLIVHEVNLNVFIENYDFVTDLLSTAGSATRAVSDRSFLSGLAN